MLADCALSLYECMFEVWSVFTNLMYTVQRAVGVQIVHAPRTVLLTNSKYARNIYISFEERSPQISSIRALRLSENVSLSTSMTAHNRCFCSMYLKEWSEEVQYLACAKMYHV